MTIAASSAVFVPRLVRLCQRNPTTGREMFPVFRAIKSQTRFCKMHSAHDISSRISVFGLDEEPGNRRLTLLQRGNIGILSVKPREEDGVSILGILLLHSRPTTTMKTLCRHATMSNVDKPATITTDKTALTYPVVRERIVLENTADCRNYVIFEMLR